MTLIIGVLCSDGIVMGADGAATLGSMGQTTIRQPVKKLHIATDNALVGICGSVGLGQLLIDEVNNRKISGQRPEQVMVTMRDKFWLHQHREMAIANTAAQNLNNRNLLSEATCQVILGLHINGLNHLFAFTQQGSPEQITERLPFVAAGCGQAIADPFLGFIRRVIWLGKTPNLSEGTFAVVWTLQHAIESSPGGVAGPIQITILDDDSKGRPRARELEQSELDEHQQYIADVESKLNEFCTYGGNSHPLPEPPHPPS
jgi:20S proteasome alpha/beta subunit